MISILALLAMVIVIFSNNTTTQAQSTPTAGGSTAVINEGVPGGTFTRSFEINARVTGVDSANRKVALQGQGGDEFSVKLRREAVDIDNIQVGDMVNASVIEKQVVYLKTGSAALQGTSLKAFGYLETGQDEQMEDGSAGIVVLAVNGAQPGGLISETVQVTAMIKAIDPINRFATLRFEDGTYRTFHVRDDIDLSRRRVGEELMFRTTEMVAISVEKP
jgi:hypothetical protein